jgi:NAD(P)-dependent dehydrogenase (short-subunit alcohol dehydrogenase family)
MVRIKRSAYPFLVRLPLVADVTDQKAIERMVANVEQQLGSIDLLANNAGIHAPAGPDWEVDPDAWWRTIEANLHGPFLVARAVLPSMIARRRGRIINISSGATFGGDPYLSAYGVSKAAITNLTNGLAKATMGYGISAFAYCPGHVRTGMTEYLHESPDVARWHGDRFNNPSRPESRYTPMERAVNGFMFLASGRGDVLSGRHLQDSDGLVELVRRADEIQRDSLYILRRLRLP